MTHTTKQIAIVLGIIAVASLIFISVLVKDSRDGLTKSFSEKCKYGGKEYKLGDGFKAIDGCNTCSCGEDGLVSCTLMACE